MKRIIKVWGTILAAFLFLALVAQPVLAEEYTTTTTVTYQRIEYEDGTFGNVNTTNTTRVFTDGNWPEFVEYGGEFEGDDLVAYNETDILTGVRVGPAFENQYRINSSVSIAATNDDARNSVWGDGSEWFDTYDTPEYIQINDTVAMCKIYIKLSSDDIMNGVQEMWYRSPLKWDQYLYNQTSTYNFSTHHSRYRHYLNIYDYNHQLIYAGQPLYNRLDRNYFKINMPLESDETYTFYEYVKTHNDDPINDAIFYFADNQDIADDGHNSSYIFPGGVSALKITNLELGWSLIAQVGIGEAGTEKLLSYAALTNQTPDYSGADDGNDSDHWVWEILTQEWEGTVNDVDSVNITMPFRTTHRTTLRIFLHTMSDGTLNTTGPFYLENITGTISATIPVNDPAAGEPNTYWLQIQIVNVTESNHWWTYTMYPSAGDYHINNAVSFDVTGSEIIGESRVLINHNHFAVYWEIEETEVVVPEVVDKSIRYDTVLLGVGIITVGILAVVTGVLHGNIPLVAVGIGAIVAGAYTFKVGLEGTAPGEAFEGMLNEALKLGKTIFRYAGEILSDPLGAGYGFLFDLWEKVVEVVKVLLEYSTMIFAAIYEIIYFAAFLAVAWMAVKFMTIMKHIAAGNIEGAVKTTLSVESSVRRQTAKRTKFARKPLRKLRRRKK